MPDDSQNKLSETPQEPETPPSEPAPQASSEQSVGPPPPAEGPLRPRSEASEARLGRPAEEPKLSIPEPEKLPAPSRLEEIAPHDPGVHLLSKKRWFFIGIAVALLNPIFSGLLVGAFFWWKEPEMKREGKIITILAAVWGALLLLLWQATQ